MCTHTGMCVYTSMSEGPSGSRLCFREVNLTPKSRLTWSEMRLETGLPELKLSSKINFSYAHTRRAK